MSAFDSLGLAMIPSAYKGEADVNNAGGYLGKVYSVLPEQTIGDNIITNGTFDSDTAWSKGAGWTISGGVVSCDGTQTVNSALVQQSTILGANLNIENNKTYRITFDITVSAGFITNIEIGSGYNYNQISTSQIGYTVDFNSGTSGNDRLTITANPDFVGTIDNVSLQLISDGDFDFSRGSDATRVNSQGYIESIQVLSDNLVTNGDFEQVGDELISNGGFDTDSNWIDTGTGWSIANGKASHDSTSGSELLYQQFITAGNELNKIYKLSFTISDYQSGDLRVVWGGYLTEDVIDGNGDVTLYLKATNASTDGKLYFQSFSFIGSIDNVSVKEVGQGWTFGTGWSVTEVDGNLKILGTNITSGYLLTQQMNFTSGKTYRVSFDVINNSAGNLKFNIGNLGFSPTEIVGTSTGTHTADIAVTSNWTSFVFWSNGGFTGNIDNVSIIEITDDTDIPRIDYTNAACPSLLLEPTRMNLVLQSEYKSAGDFTNATFSYNSIISPRGVNDATKIIDDSTNGQHRVFIGSFSVTSGLNYTVSAFVKNNDVGFCYILLEGDFSQTRYYFNLSTGEAITSGLKVESFANGWYRIYVTQSAAATGTGTAYLNMAINGTSAIYSGTGQSLYFYGFQAELGSYPTSYIPTNGTTVTRLADVCNNAGDSTIFNDSEGVLYADIAALYDDLTFRSISISDGTLDNRIVIRYRSDSNQINMIIEANNVIIYNASYTVMDIVNYNKIALKYKSGDIALWINGQEVLANAATFTAVGLNKLSFDGGNGSDFNYGNTRSLLYFDRALTDAELEALTSSDINRVLKNYIKRGTLLGATYENDYVTTRLNELF